LANIVTTCRVQAGLLDSPTRTSRANWKNFKGIGWWADSNCTDFGRNRLVRCNWGHPWHVDVMGDRSVNGRAEQSGKRAEWRLLKWQWRNATGTC